MGSIEGVSKPLSERTSDCTYVYGTRFATMALPSHQLPDGGMPKEVAYQMIKDDLALDGQPILNLASFVTTYMEDEALKLLVESSNKNVIDHEEYPKSVEIEHRCLNILADLFHSPVSKGNPTAFGTSCIGSSEAIMLAVLAMKKRWEANRKAQGKDFSNPNIIMSSGVQVCWEKAAKYFDIAEKLVPCTETRYVIDPVLAVDMVDENTIGICAILGTTYTGQYENVQAISELLLEKGLDTPIHVDAASGGFVAPFVNPDLVWDFKLPNVVSINVSGHKYGLVYPGIGWALWRSPEYLPEDLVFNIDYLGSEQLNFTMNFSKPASHIIAQYYQLIRLGRSGYTSIMRNLTKTADYLTSQLQEMGFIIMSEGNGHGLPVVAFRLSPTQNVIFDEWALARKLRERGWIVPAYTMAADCTEMGMMRAVVRTDFSMGRCVSLVRDIQDALGDLAGVEIRNIQRYQALVQRPDCTVIPATGDNPATILALPLLPSDAMVSLGTSTTFLMSTPSYKPDPATHFFNHPTTPGLYMFMLCYKNGGLAREHVRDAINESLKDTPAQPWANFDKVALQTAPLGQQNPSDPMKMGLFFPRHEIVPNISKGQWRFTYDANTGSLKETTDGWNAPQDEARAIIESQLLSLRLRSRDLTQNPGNGLPSQPRRVYLVGGGSKNKAIAKIAGEVLGGVEGVYSLDVGDNACALGAAYKAVWGIERQPGQTFEDLIGQRWNEDEFIEKIAEGYQKGVFEQYGQAVEGFEKMELQVLQQEADKAN